MRRVRALFGPKEAYLGVLLLLGYASLHGHVLALPAFTAVAALCIVRAA